MMTEKRFSEAERDQIRQKLISIGGVPGAETEDTIDFFDQHATHTLEYILTYLETERETLAVAKKIFDSMPPEEALSLRAKIRKDIEAADQGEFITIEDLCNEINSHAPPVEHKMETDGLPPIDKFLAKETGEPRT